MPGLAGFALGAAPIAGGALLTIAAGQFKAPDFRGLMKQDQDLLDRSRAGALLAYPRGVHSDDGPAAFWR